MQFSGDRVFLATNLRSRRQKLAYFNDNPAILWSGNYLARNFPANTFPFRASSHFLYFAGLPLVNAAIRLAGGRLELYLDEPPPETSLWHGESLSRDTIAEIIGADAAYPLKELAAKADNAATIPLSDPQTFRQQCALLNRPVSSLDNLSGIDLNLAKAIITLRSRHDELALQELRQAAAVSVEAHLVGMKATKKAKTEAEIRGAMEGAIIARNFSCAYNSIVTVHGEVLHNNYYHHQLQADDLLLADVGAETPNGWAADITRTWSIGGKFSPTQRDIYNLVLEAHDTCIATMRPGVEYREIHLLAAKVIAEGLVNLGILKGNPEDLVSMDAHALFFPHGIGHLLGLDVHDMEDLGDLAGYTWGRTRSARFGLGYLRLDRPLQPGMLVTIEPGFYQVPAILNHLEFCDRYKDVVNWDLLAQFKDVRGIRIEDDVLVTESGTEILTAQLPTKLDAIEALCS